MAAIIKIKRSEGVTAPTSLNAGELAFTYNDSGNNYAGTSANNGERLFIGDGTNVQVIGGKYFTDIIDAKTSSNTGSTLVERDSSGNFSAGTITANLTGNVTGDVTGNADTASAWETARTITLAGDLGGSVSVDGSGDVTLTATVQADSVALGTDTTGNYVATIADAGNSNITVANSGSETAGVTLDLTDTGVTADTYGSTSAVPVITVDAKGRVTSLSTSTITTSFDIAADSGTQDTVAGGEALTFTGGEGIDTAVTNNTITISAEVASDTNPGVATFNTADFAVSSGGDVTIKTNGVSNAQLANSSFTIGDDTRSLGDTFTTLDNVTIGGTTAAAGSFTTVSASGNTSVGGNLSVTGDLTINGTTTTVNSTTVTIDDPIFTLGGDTAPNSDDNKDRGIEFKWHDGTNAKTGFFGYDDSAQKFTFIADATQSSSEVFTGTAGDVVFGNISGDDISGTIDGGTF